MSEPVITINGRLLTSGQAMAVRVAISSFHQECRDPGHLGDDADARRLTEAYRDRLTEVLQAITTPKPTPPQLGIRAHRILMLAGLVPERATERQRQMAESYAVTGMAIDEAAMRLKRALEIA